MNMGRKWDHTACFLCDFWWLLLLLLVIIIAGILGTRNMWMPEPVPTPTVAPTPVPTVTIVPTSIPTGFNIPSDADGAELCPGAVAYFDWGINIPSAAQSSDFIFAFDQTGSMDNVIDEAQQTASQLMEMINASVGDARFGVVGFSDYPIYSASDFPYRLYQPLTNNHDSIQDAIDSLDIYSGGDSSESYGRVMYESYTDPSIGWRERSRHFLIFFGDEFPHDPDAGVDGQYQTSDDLDIENVIGNMGANEIILVYIASTYVGSDLLSYWQNWTNETGGVTVSLIEDGSFSEVVDTAISTVSRHIDELDLEVGPDQYQSWASADPITDITIEDKEELIHMPITFMIPEDFTEPGRHTMKLIAVGDGADFASFDFTITFPQECVQK